MPFKLYSASKTSDPLTPNRIKALQRVIDKLGRAKITIRYYLSDGTKAGNYTYLGSSKIQAWSVQGISQAIKDIDKTLLKR